MNQKHLFSVRLQTIAMLLVSAVGILMATLASPVAAHEGRDVGDYNLVVGFLREPAYEGHLNGVSLIVTRALHDASDTAGSMSMDHDSAQSRGDDDHGDEDEDGSAMKRDEMTTILKDESPSVTADTSTDRVTRLVSTLQVEVTHLSTTASKAMPLTEVYNDPGHYVAEFVPTAPGDYRMRFFGLIEGTAIDETFDAGPDTFDTVIASDAIQFPVVLESNRELQNATQGALDAVQDLETELDSTATTGMIIGIIGIVFGTIATGFSIFALTVARRRN